MAKIILFRRPNLSPSITNDDEMLVDAADLGCVYGAGVSAAQMGTNKVRIHDAIQDFISNGTGGGIMISGPAVSIGPVTTRIAGQLHVDVNPASTAGELATNPAARGPIKFPTDGSGNVIPFIIKGLPDSLLDGRGVQESANVPGHVIEIDNSTGQGTGDPDRGTLQLIQNLCIRSRSRGIWIKRGGRQTILDKVYVRTTGLLSDTPFSASTTWTEWHDWSSFQTRINSDNVPYAIRIDNSDGVQLLDCVIKDCDTHGLIITRLHDGHIDMRSSENKGVGVAADILRGTDINLRAESNGSYALLADRMSECNKVDIWPENNRRWNSNQLFSFTGNKHRCVNLGAGCQSNEFTVHATNRHNLWRQRESTRLVNRYRDVDWNDPSKTATVDTTDAAVTNAHLDTSTTNSWHNYDVVWSSSTFRPTMTLSGNDIVLTIKAGAFNTANLSSGAGTATSFMYPFAAVAGLPSVAEGDHVAWSCEVEFNAAAVDFCQSAESGRGTNLTLANPLFIKLIHANDPSVYKEVEQAHANCHVWNQGSVAARKRIFSGRKQIFSGGSTAWPDLSIGTWTGGLDNSGPSVDITITIRSLSMWHLPRDL